MKGSLKESLKESSKENSKESTKEILKGSLKECSKIDLENKLTLHKNIQTFLVMGGMGSGFLDSTETFDPMVGSWAASAKLPQAIIGIRATNINDRVLIFGIINLDSCHKRCRDSRNIMIAGGLDSSSNVLDDILEYDLVEDTIIPVGHMIQARFMHAISVVKVEDYLQWCQ